MTVAASILPGFADPVGQSQQTFRAVIDAMARPGTVHSVTLPEANPGPWPAAITALSLTLFDQDTAVWLDPAAGSAEATAFLRFHCGCPLVDAPADANFAVILNPASAPPLYAFSIGDPLYPERSATIVLAVDALSGGAPLRLSGPGVKDVSEITPAGLPEGFIGQWADNHALYPSGFDVVLAADDELLALPRGVAIEEG